MTRCSTDGCGNRVRSNGMMKPEPICGKCLMTPPEIRGRELRGCLSLMYLRSPAEDAAYVARERAKEQAKTMSRATAKVHRSRFRLA